MSLSTSVSNLPFGECLWGSHRPMLWENLSPICFCLVRYSNKTKLIPVTSSHYAKTLLHTGVVYKYVQLMRYVYINHSPQYKRQRPATHFVCDRGAWPLSTSVQRKWPGSVFKCLNRPPETSVVRLRTTSLVTHVSARVNFADWRVIHHISNQCS